MIPQEGTSAAPDLSVVVPCYNAAPYLERCVHSCLQRELPDELWKRCEAQVVFHASRLADAMLERGLGFKPLRSVPLAPFARVPAGSRVAIWGAGRMGQAYRRQLSDDGYAPVVAWVDELWEDARNCGLDVDEPSALAESGFDVVVLALEGPFRLRLACNALRRMGVAPERIVGPGNSITL